MRIGCWVTENPELFENWMVTDALTLSPEVLMYRGESAVGELLESDVTVIAGFSDGLGGVGAEPLLQAAIAIKNGIDKLKTK